MTLDEHIDKLQAKIDAGQEITDDEVIAAAVAHEHPLTPEARILQFMLHTGALKLRDGALVSFSRSPDYRLDFEEIATVEALLRGLESGAEA